jgi:hypothetical protein
MLNLKKVDSYANVRMKDPLDRKRLPQPVFDVNSALVDFYWVAWESAWRHVINQPGAPQPRYMDEAMTLSTNWIWDTCFMALFCKYAPQLFPGIESLDNFYRILYDGKTAPFKIHFADNPPLFAWVEWAYFQMTGDSSRLYKILVEKQYLQQHFKFMDYASKVKKNRFVNVKPVACRVPLGYRWRGNTSGMDNTPRGRNWWNDRILNPRRQIQWNNILWVDLLAQQALNAEYIAKIAYVCKQKTIENEYHEIFQNLCTILNKFYWDPQDQFYYDLKNKPLFVLQWMVNNKDSRRFNKVKTTASFWPMLAKMCTVDQAQSLANTVKDPKQFGGEVPWPSLARNDKDFEPLGRYWRGGVWIPLAYMGIKALEQYRFFNLANQTAEKIFFHMLQTYQGFTPHTIWEVYSPTESKPSTLKDNIHSVRDDFCGWSALGPISLFIENILGFHEINAPEHRIQWEIHQTGRHGIQNLQFGNIQTDLIWEKETIFVHASAPYDLEICDSHGMIRKKISIHLGDQTIPYPSRV